MLSHYLSLLACLAIGLLSTIQSVHSYELAKIKALRIALNDLKGGYAEALPEFLLEPRSNVSSSNCATTCVVLGYVLKSDTGQFGTAVYEQTNLYWSNQQTETSPACRILPKSAKDVAAAFLVTKFLSCPFAVKSGGHGAFAGASNIQDGVTIDLRNVDEIEVNKDRNLTHVGTGNTWGDVYSKLDPQKLSVVGGRVAAIGVGGLTLGGGISFFSGRRGWACDGVLNYEVYWSSPMKYPELTSDKVVLASGKIANVNQKSYPDLYFALRGGGNNFGIVTRLDLETFAQGDLWGGMSVYPAEAQDSIYTALDNFANNAPSDPDAALIVAFVYAFGQYLFSNDYEYANPVVNPPIFREFTSIPNIRSTLRITNLTDLTTELNASNPSGYRQTYWTATFKSSPVLLNRINGLFVHEVNGIKDAKAILPALVMQPITKPMISQFSKRGGNALGIPESDGPLILLNIAISWSSKSDDERIIAAAKRIVDGSVAAAKEMGLDYKYLYQNYAALSQNVFAGYGVANQQRLRDVSRKCDPEQVFLKLQPGYFKLDAENGGQET